MYITINLLFVGDFMSVTLMLAPVAVAVVASGAPLSVAVTGLISKKLTNKDLQKHAFKTEFNDLVTLKKALEDCGAEIKVLSGDSMIAKCCGGTLLYQRDREKDGVYMYIVSLDDQKELLQDLDDLKDVYGMNVQDFTYNKIKEHIPSGMHLETEEVLDDDSIQMVLVMDE